jgi:prefoldin subunit 5
MRCIICGSECKDLHEAATLHTLRAVDSRIEELEERNKTLEETIAKLTRAFPFIKRLLLEIEK